MKTKNTTKMTHTPGPWHVAGFGVFGPQAKLKDAIAITSVRESDPKNIAGLSKFDQPEREANVRLIAAAPELLEVAKKWAAWYKLGWMPQSRMSREDEAFLHAVISKATGVQRCSGTDRHCPDCDDCHAKGGCAEGK